MVNTKQILVVGLVIVLMGALLAQPIKGLVDKNKGETSATAESSSSSKYNLESVSAMAKQGVNASLAQDISAIEAQVAKAEGEAKVTLLQQLAAKWDDVAKPIPQGFIYEEMANISPKLEYWLKAGDAFRTVVIVKRIDLRFYLLQHSLDLLPLPRVIGQYPTLDC